MSGDPVGRASPKALPALLRRSGYAKAQRHAVGPDSYRGDDCGRAFKSDRQLALYEKQTLLQDQFRKIIDKYKSSYSYAK